MKRSYLPLVIAGVFAILLLGGLGIFIVKSKPLPPSEQELAANFDKGVQYEHGEGVSLDYGQALAWYRKSADAGYARAEFAVGLMTEAGRGIVRDEKAALDWFRRAAEHGLPDAQVRLAGELVTGNASADGKPDKVEAMKWLLLGADGMPDPLGQQIAVTTRDKLAATLTPEERDEAEKRAKAWRKAHAPQ